jgi:hypothetical protein
MNFEHELKICKTKRKSWHFYSTSACGGLPIAITASLILQCRSVEKKKDTKCTNFNNKFWCSRTREGNLHAVFSPNLETPERLNSKAPKISGTREEADCKVKSTNVAALYKLKTGTTKTPNTQAMICAPTHTEARNVQAQNTKHGMCMRPYLHNNTEITNKEMQKKS